MQWYILNISGGKALFIFVSVSLFRLDIFSSKPKITYIYRQISGDMEIPLWLFVRVGLYSTFIPGFYLSFEFTLLLFDVFSRSPGRILLQ